MFLHSTREGDYPNQIQHPENIPHPLQTAGPEVNRAFNLMNPEHEAAAISNEPFGWDLQMSWSTLQLQACMLSKTKLSLRSWHHF